MKTDSGFHRLVSASAASWIRIGITFITQIALIPLYLQHWNAETFAAWLLLQSLATLITSIDIAHHDYVGFECLRIDTNRKITVSKIICSAAPYAFAIAIIGGLISVIIAWYSPLAHSFSEDPHLMRQWQFAVLLQAVTWTFTTSQGGLLVRWLLPFNYNSKLAWWAVIKSIAVTFAPAVAVMNGANLLNAAVALSLANIFYYVVFGLACKKYFNKETLHLESIDLKEGGARAAKSMWLTAKYLTEAGQQQGARILIAPLAGPVETATFATLKTGSNFALQGLKTITNPLMPELMRFLRQKDQEKVEASFCAVWLVVFSILFPIIIILQYAGPTLFPLWTRGKITFDPLLFLLLSLSVLVYATAQPAISILQGMNKLRLQLLAGVTAVTVTIIGTIIGIPMFGIKAAGAALILAELLNLTINTMGAQTALKEYGLKWPWKTFSKTLLGLLIVSFSSISIIISDAAIKFHVFTASLLLQLIMIKYYWSFMPGIARKRILKILRFRRRNQ